MDEFYYLSVALRSLSCVECTAHEYSPLLTAQITRLWWLRCDYVEILLQIVCVSCRVATSNDGTKFFIERREYLFTFYFDWVESLLRWGLCSTDARRLDGDVADAARHAAGDDVGVAAAVRRTHDETRAPGRTPARYVLVTSTRTKPLTSSLKL